MEGSGRDNCVRLFHLWRNWLLWFHRCWIYFMFCSYTRYTTVIQNKTKQITGQWLNLSFTVAMGKMTAKYRFRLSNKIDNRIRVMNEIIQGIQIIKVYAWEKPFAKIVDAMRK